MNSELVQVMVVLYNARSGEVIFKPTVGGRAMQSQEAASSLLTESASDLADKYLAWGRQYGGKDGTAWNKYHGKNVQHDLDAWLSSPDFPKDLSKLTPAAVEKHLGAMKAETKNDGEPRYAPKTIADRFTSLKSFVNWCIRRKHLAEDPMRGCVKPNGKPVKQCRILTYLEFQRLEKVAPDYRALVYRLAVQTGLRQDEMRKLRVRDLDVQNARIFLNWINEKTRQNRWFPLTPMLAAKLKEQAGNAGPNEPLIRVTTSPIHEFDKDCARCLIEKITVDGTIDFHGLRRTAITWFEESGASEGQIRAFGRHSVRSTTQRYRLPKIDDIRALMCIVEQRLEKKVVEDTGVEPVTFRLPACGVTTDDVTSKSIVDLAWHACGEKHRRAILALSEVALRQFFGSKS